MPRPSKREFHEARDVFVETGYPTVTHVARKSAELSKLRANLRRHQLHRLCGPARSGKTTFVIDTFREVGMEPIVVKGTSLHKTGDFYAQAATQISMRRKNPSDADIRSAVKNSRRPLVVDDFHRIGGAKFKEQNYRDEIIDWILSETKSLLDGPPAFTVVLITPSDDDIQEMLKSHPDMMERSTLRVFPPWTNDDLALIANNGFAALNVEYDEQIVGWLVSQSEGSPQSMQRACGELCDENGVARTTAQTSRAFRNLTEDEVLARYAAMAKGKEQQIIDVLRPQNRAKNDRNVLLSCPSGKKIHLFEALLLLLVRAERDNQSTYADIVSEYAKCGFTPSRLSQRELREHLAEMNRRLDRLEDDEHTLILNKTVVLPMSAIFRSLMVRTMAPKLEKTIFGGDVKSRAPRPARAGK